MLLVTVITFYITRLVLLTLGVEDFGLYTVIAGVIALLGFISGSLSGASSRFITYALGKGNKDHLQRNFTAVLFIYLAFSLIVILIAETIGLGFLKNTLNIPKDRYEIACLTYHAVVALTIITFLSSPFQSLIIAYERMNIYAYISIIDSLLKLIVAYIIKFSPIDKLLSYALFLAAAQLITLVLYILYCKYNFTDVQITFKRTSNNEIKPILQYMFWITTSSIAVIFNSQGINILLNIFFNALVNAARGIAVQVEGGINMFFNNILTAIRPQIIKSYAQNNFIFFKSLIFQGSKLMACLCFVVCIPLYFSLDFILELWLDTVPNHTNNFIKLLFLAALSRCLAGPILTGLHATGNIRNFQIIESISLSSTIPISIIGLTYLEFSPIHVIATYVFIELFTQAIRIIVILPKIRISTIEYIKRVILPVISTGIFSFLCSYFIHSQFNLYTNSFLSLVTNSLIYISIISISCFFCLLNKQERTYAISLIKHKLVSN